MADDTQPDITTLTVQLLSAFVSNNSFAAAGLPDLIKSTRAALTAAPEATDGAAARETYVPAVSVRKSLSSPDHIISLIDGKPYKTLKRHLTTHGLTADQYRERYSLPKSYPLVAPNYSEARRAVAAKLGLGQRPATLAAAETVEALTAPPSAPTLPRGANNAAQKKASTAPAKKRVPNKVEAAEPVSQPAEAPAVAPAKAPTAKPQGRKRLSIALAQEEAAISAPADTKAPTPVELEAAVKSTAPTAEPKTGPKKANAAAKPVGKKPTAKAKSAKRVKNGAEQATPDDLAAQSPKAE